VNTVQHWAKTFVDTLQQPIPHTPRLTRTLNTRLIHGLNYDFRQAKKRLLFLDYDGTLVPFSAHYKNTHPPKAIIKLLSDLSANPVNEVVLISGRSADFLQKWFGAIPMNLVAEHGAAIKKNENKNWQTIDKTSTSWKKLLLPVLKKYARLAPGAHVEVKSNSLVWHYRAAKPYNAQKYAVIIKRSLKPILKKYGLEILQGNKVLEIKNPQISKANAAKQWLDQNYPFVLFIGDDLTDEDLFLALSPDSYAIKVGRGRTAARFRVDSSRDVVGLLRKLAKL
jgi:trehalose 6-phosphate synthase/phosphatase